MWVGLIFLKKDTNIWLKLFFILNKNMSVVRILMSILNVRNFLQISITSNKTALFFITLTPFCLTIILILSLPLL